jgi:ubiquinone/menaquinone biosynthesis C-methylase UbiE
MVRAARRDLPYMTFRTAPADKLPFDDGFFDVVTVCTAFHHVPDVEAFAREAHRVLVPGGALYIAEVYYPRWLRVLANPFIRLHPSGDVRLYSPREIEGVLQDNGFSTEPAMIEGKIQIVAANKSDN